MCFPYVRALMAVAVIGVAAAPAAAGLYTFTTVSPPDLSFTGISGVSSSGTAVGTGLDSTGNVVSFLYSGGNFSTINFRVDARLAHHRYCD